MTTGIHLVFPFSTQAITALFLVPQTTLNPHRPGVKVRVYIIKFAYTLGSGRKCSITVPRPTRIGLRFPNRVSGS